MAVLLSATRLEKHFASRKLFSNLSFAIHDRDRVGLIGPNGAGKSTLLKIISGQIEADSGEVARSRGLRIGVLDQSPEFPEGQTIFEALHGATLDPYEAISYQAVDEMISKLELDRLPLGADTRVEDLSGGWRKRVALGRALMIEPQVLILDEPTNHLDVPSIVWLENFLQASQFALITVTHDRVFLQNVATRIFDLDPKLPSGLLTVEGDYSRYLTTRDELLAAQERHESVMRNQLRREAEWLARGAKARQAKQKARGERAEELAADLREVAGRNINRTARIEFQDMGRAPKKLIYAKDLKIERGGQVLVDGLEILIAPSTRIGLLGANGCGKSTLIRVLIGQDEQDGGIIERADDLRISYYEQHRETLDMNVSVLRTLCPEGDYVHFQGRPVFVRSYLGRFLFRGEQMDMPVGKLSGGEQSRLRIAQLMLTPANLLILDEPTNDLDMETLNVLEETLREFQGAVILVSHDRYFMDQVAQDVLAFSKTPDGGVQLDRFSGYAQWSAWAEDELVRTKELARNKDSARAKDSAKSKSNDKSGDTNKEATSFGNQKSKLSQKERFELEKIEVEIQKHEAMVAEIEKTLIDPAMAQNLKQLAHASTELSRVQGEVERLYKRWAELEAKAGGGQVDTKAKP